jgi:hypothetical protein
MFGILGIEMGVKQCSEPLALSFVNTDGYGSRSHLPRQGHRRA